MKSILFIIVFISLISCVSKKNAITTGFEGKPLPSFNLLLMDSTTTINTNDIPKSAPIVLFFISPYCPYCKAQTKQILTDIKSLSNIHLYLITSLPYSDLKKFYEHFDLKKYPEITVGYDYTSFFGHYYKVNSVPYIAIFNRKKILRQVFTGNVKTDILKDIALQ